MKRTKAKARTRRTVKKVVKIIERRKARDRRANARSSEEFDALLAELKNEQRRSAVFEARGNELEQQVMRLDALIPESFVWTCGDGRRLRPSEMDEQHLRNTISFLQRTMIYKFGTGVYIDTVAEKALAFYEMVKEAKTRGFRV